MPVAADDDDVVDDAVEVAAEDDVDDDELEPPHALTAAAMAKRQAAIAASLLRRTALRILGLSSAWCSLHAGTPSGRCIFRSICGRAGADVNSFVNDLDALTRIVK